MSDKQKRENKAGQGLLIAFEGIDGCGKTTQAGFLNSWLRSKHLPTVLTYEPGGTRVGEQIRQILLDPENKDMRPEAELMLHIAARVQQYFDVIRPALLQGSIVIIDRFTDSSLAYQGHGRGIDKKLIEAIHNVALEGVTPDLTIVLDIDPEVGQLRKMASLSHGDTKGTVDRMDAEATEFRKAVRIGYSAIAVDHPDRIKLIDASGTSEYVFEQVKTYAEELLVARKFI